MEMVVKLTLIKNLRFSLLSFSSSLVERFFGWNPKFFVGILVRNKILNTLTVKTSRMWNYLPIYAKTCISCMKPDIVQVHVKNHQFPILAGYLKIRVWFFRLVSFSQAHFLNIIKNHWFNTIATEFRVIFSTRN